MQGQRPLGSTAGRGTVALACEEQEGCVGALAVLQCLLGKARVRRHSPSLENRSLTCRLPRPPRLGGGQGWEVWMCSVPLVAALLPGLGLGGGAARKGEARSALGDSASVDVLALGCPCRPLLGSAPAGGGGSGAEAQPALAQAAAGKLTTVQGSVWGNRGTYGAGQLPKTIHVEASALGSWPAFRFAHGCWT